MKYTFKIENDKLICVCHDTNELSNNFDTYIKSPKFVNMKIVSLDRYNYETVTFKNNSVYLKDSYGNVVKFVNFGELVFKYQINKYLKNNFPKIKQAIFNYQKDKITKQLPKNLKLNKGKVIVAASILGILCVNKVTQDHLDNEVAIETEFDGTDLNSNIEIAPTKDIEIDSNKNNIIEDYKISIDEKNEVIPEKIETSNDEIKLDDQISIVNENEVNQTFTPIEANQIIQNVDEETYAYEVESTDDKKDLPVQIEESIDTNSNNEIHINSTTIPINIANNSDDETIDNINTKYGDIINECSKKWGISSNLITALICQESRGKLKNLGQIEFHQWNDMPIDVHNFITNADEKIVLTNNPNKYNGMTTVSEEELLNPKTNISVSTIILRYNLQRNNFNVPITIQEYNYGCGNMNKVLTVAANNSGTTKEDIINNPENLDFMDYRTIINGGNKAHGDDEYIEHVLQYVDGDVLIKMPEGNDIVYNVEHQKALVK